jgi:hypothetical protein
LAYLPICFNCSVIPALKKSGEIKLTENFWGKAAAVKRRSVNSFTPPPVAWRVGVEKAWRKQILSWLPNAGVSQVSEHSINILELLSFPVGFDTDFAMA